MDRSFETRYETGHTNIDDVVHRENRRSKPDRRKTARTSADLNDEPLLTQAEIDFLLHN